MEAIRETTAWEFPNHTYLLDGTTLVAYIKQGTTDAVFLKSGIKNFDKRRRTFEKASKDLFEGSASSNLIEVQGSKGSVYYVDPENATCTCPGYTFRGKCRHTDILVDKLVV
jgi:uncharacterized Zn finger protein